MRIVEGQTTSLIDGQQPSRQRAGPHYFLADTFRPSEPATFVAGVLPATFSLASWFSAGHVQIESVVELTGLRKLPPPLLFHHSAPATFVAGVRIVSFSQYSKFPY